ncbi:MAG TPA: hypothetical protein VFQ39_03565 [Longimicrobium sp.]|nr:hypothetical protein [Longimicrobium sp.]
MRKLTLNLDQLAVESLPTTPQQPAPADDRGGDPLTCLQTNCGKILCCA